MEKKVPKVSFLPTFIMVCTGTTGFLSGLLILIPSLKNGKRKKKSGNKRFIRPQYNKLNGLAVELDEFKQIK
ncbi:hypothetical protein AOA57_29720 [Pseudomonas sp. 2588-5]|nr:hypothetical protein AOA57_29720 [Pseudomonas sp. 2588-5]